VGDCEGVYLYSIDDLKTACEENANSATASCPPRGGSSTGGDRFMTDFHHRATGPVIRRLLDGWSGPKKRNSSGSWQAPDLNERSRAEIRQAFDRLVNKLLHPRSNRFATNRGTAFQRAHGGAGEAVSAQRLTRRLTDRRVGQAAAPAAPAHRALPHQRAGVPALRLSHPTGAGSRLHERCHRVGGMYAEGQFR